MRRSATFLIAVAALTVPLGLGAQTLDLPQLKAGLWEIAVGGVAGTSVTSLMCVDATNDRDAMMEYALKSSGKGCKNALKRQGSTYTIDTECTISGTAVKSRTVITGDFSSTYTTRTEGTVQSGPGKETVSIVITQTAKWKSADCAGMKPGDISLLGDTKVKIKQMK